MNPAIDGKAFCSAIISAANVINDKKKAVDELNVFPVPDGDTGSNMSMTILNAAASLKGLPDGVPIGEAAEKTAAAMLRGARGNSGVILSLLFRGFATALKGQSEMDASLLDESLRLGVEGAYKSVMNPTEGTILTVARKAAEKAHESAISSNDPLIVFGDASLAAQKALEETPTQLPLLAKAGVVDAGGMGLVIILDEMNRIFGGGDIFAEADEKLTVESFSNAVGKFDDEINYAYCTEMLVTKAKKGEYADKIKAYLELIGDCVVVVEDDEVIKIHVHTNEPGFAIQKGLEFGYINMPKIENMRLQHENQKKKGAEPAKPEKPYGFVAVAAGSGIEAIFTDLGADCIVKGGQTMNPSTDDILSAILSCPAETVFVLPNNKNIIMAAQQAVSLADRRVCVLETRSIQQGMSAMMAFDETLDFAANRLEMTKAFERVSAGQITFAARDRELGSHQIKQGEILAIENGKLAFTEKDVTKAAFKLVKKMVSSSASFVTVLYGADVTDSDAEALHAALQKRFSSLEINTARGGQPIYYYLISVE
ncbi:MAG: DAK2 domain-containing protein [Ruminococcus sp.]|nr:DAK2 domain-containing protein [Ruminococcus sp.]